MEHWFWCVPFNYMWISIWNKELMARNSLWHCFQYKKYMENQRIFCAEQRCHRPFFAVSSFLQIGTESFSCNGPFEWYRKCDQYEIGRLAKIPKIVPSSAGTPIRNNYKENSSYIQSSRIINKNFFLLDFLSIWSM